MKKSFTLIELLIVLVIIGVLVTLAAPQYEKFVIRSQSAEAKTVVKIWADEYWNYYMEAGKLPSEVVGAPQFPQSVEAESLKYFLLGLTGWTGPGGTSYYLYAARKDYRTTLPVGEVMSYAVIYSMIPDMFPAGTKMNHVWYKYYAHQKKTEVIDVQPITDFPFLDGWP